MDDLNIIRPNMQSYGNFVRHKSAVACAFCRAFGFDLGKDAVHVRVVKD